MARRVESNKSLRFGTFRGREGTDVEGISGLEITDVHNSVHPPRSSQGPGDMNRALH